MLVGITTQKVRNYNYKEIGYYINSTWGEFSKKTNIELIPFTNLTSTKKIIKSIKPKGLILSGGGTISPKFPNIEKVKDNLLIKKFDIERENIEKILISLACSTNIPLIGICRGMQAIVKYFGSKLFKVNGHVKTRHKVNYYCPILKKNIKRTINSYHDYGVSTSEVSKSFDIITSYKNTAEFIRHKEKKIFGIMWHPERERLFNEYDIMLIQKLFKY